MHSHRDGFGGRGVRLASWSRVLVLLVLTAALVGCGAVPRPSPADTGEPTGDPNATPPSSFGAASLQVDGPPVATVDGVAITRQEWADRVNLIRFRYDRERTRLQAQVAAGEVDEQAAQEQLMGLASNAAEAESVAVDQLIDLALQGRLAREQLLTIGPADVAAAQSAEAHGDAAFLTDLARSVSEAAYRRNLEAEVLAEKLREEIVDRATADTVDQLRVSEILLQGVEDSEGGIDSGAIRASHIVYSPKDDWENAPGLPLDDPAWLEAETAAEATADALEAISDRPARIERFAELARTESDEPETAEIGGDIGWVSPDQLAPDMADALFASSHEPGDIIGPVSTEFGSSVVLYVDRRAPLAERVASVQSRLAQPGADFAAIARAESDGEEAANGGDLGWLAPFEADPAVEDALRAATAGQVIGPLTLDDGVHFYRIEARETRSLTPEQRESLVETAFDAWYLPKREAAFEQGLITIADDAP